MKIGGLAITMGVGAAVGAVAIMMLPRQSAIRKLAGKAADKVEDAACSVGARISNSMYL